MRPIALAAVISLAVFGLATPCLGQTAANHTLMAEATNLTVRDGSDAGPTQTALPGQADDANNVADLPRIATHAPTRLGLPVADSTSSDSQ
jgi:hypothetical protein